MASHNADSLAGQGAFGARKPRDEPMTTEGVGQRSALASYCLTRSSTLSAPSKAMLPSPRSPQRPCPRAPLPATGPSPPTQPPRLPARRTTRMCSRTRTRARKPQGYRHRTRWAVPLRQTSTRVPAYRLGMNSWQIDTTRRVLRLEEFESLALGDRMLPAVKGMKCRSKTGVTNKGQAGIAINLQ